MGASIRDLFFGMGMFSTLLLSQLFVDQPHERVVKQTHQHQGTKRIPTPTAQQQWLHRHHRPIALLGRRRRKTRRSLHHHHLVGNIIMTVKLSKVAVENLLHQHHYLSPPWKMDHQQHLLMTNITIREAEERE
jgi:hypothetical protein